MIETSKSSDLGKASLILLNIRCSGFKDREDLVNRVEGQWNKGLSADTCIPGLLWMS